MKDDVKAISQRGKKCRVLSVVLAGVLEISYKKTRNCERFLKSKRITKYKNIGEEEKIVFLSLTFFSKTYAV